MAADPALVAKLREALSGRTDVRLALLFGSRARGRERPGSDADVAVLGRDNLDLLALGRDLSLAAGLDVDVTDLSRAGYPLLQAVLRDGLVLHQGERGAAGRWRAHAIAEVETDRPWFERMRDAYLRRLAREALEERHG
jgi:predicted nucleotidyltransferase